MSSASSINVYGVDMFDIPVNNEILNININSNDLNDINSPNNTISHENISVMDGISIDSLEIESELNKPETSTCVVYFCF